MCILEPEMGDFNYIVVPKISHLWDEVAYTLHYEISTVSSISNKHNDDPKKCCKELLKDWLSSNNGATPKLWSTFINKLKKVGDLTAAREEIIKELVKMYPQAS